MCEVKENIVRLLKMSKYCEKVLLREKLVFLPTIGLVKSSYCLLDKPGSRSENFGGAYSKGS